jgi:hypothetical protein
VTSDAFWLVEDDNEETNEPYLVPTLTYQCQCQCQTYKQEIVLLLLTIEIDILLVED